MKTLLEKITLVLIVLVACVKASLASPLPPPTIQGPSSTGQGSTQTYTFNNGTLVTNAYWVVTNYVSLSTPTVNGTTYSITVTWSTSASSGTIAFWGNGDPGTQQASLSVTLVTCSGILTPTSLVNGSGCGPSNTVSISATAPNSNYKVRWYNIGSNVILATGTQGAASTYTTPSISATTSYYATALLVSSGCESNPVTVTATIIYPTVTVSNKTICTGTSTGLVLTNNLPSTLNTWTTSSSGASGASNSNGTSGSTSPYTYTLNQTLTATGSGNGTVTYTITPSLSGCTGAAVPVTVTVQKVVPNAAASPTKQTLCSGATENISITNPNNVSGTVFNWTVSTTNANVPATQGTGNTITGAVNSVDGINSGSAIYTITPSIGACYGTAIKDTVNVNPTPPAPVSTGDSYTLSSGYAYFEVIVPDGMQAQWYAPSDLNTVLSTNPGFTSPNSGSQTYKVKLKNLATGCLSPLLVMANGLALLSNPSSVSEEIVRVSGQTTDAGINSLSSSQKVTTITYVDGLGRKSQVISLSATPGGNDMILPFEYDNQGRTAKDYLPYTKVSSGSFQFNYLNDLHSFYLATGDKIADDYYPFALANYEQSSLSRPLVAGSVGQEWQPGLHAKTISYTYNNGAISDEAEEVRIFNLSNNSFTQTYAANKLTRTQVTDENGNIDIVFKDGTGKTVARKQQLNGTINGSTVNYLQTYYVYDSLSRLQYIITPGGFAALKVKNFAPTQTEFDQINDQHFHQFVYDNKGRVVQKKTPGQAWSYFVYDKYNRLVLTQDGNLRPSNKWAFVKYDRYGRTVMSGLYKNTTQTTLSSMQTLVSSSAWYPSGAYYEQRATGAGTYGYTNQSSPIQNSDNSALEIYSVNYYDNYDFDNSGSADFTYDASHLSGLPASTGKYTRGLATGNRKLILGTNPALSSSWLVSAVFYDNYDRVIQTQGNNALYTNGLDKGSVIYSFDNKVIQSKNTHSPDGVTTTVILQTPNFDMQGRVAVIYHSINGAANQMVAKYQYNELGQVVTKQLHSNDGTNFLQNVDFRYNIKGWLTSINNAQLTNDSNVTNGDTNDYFGMELNYNTDAGTSNTLYYNGNVSAVKWKGAGATSGASDQRSYNFSYDKTDKLTAATFQKYGTTAWNKEVNTINETMSYDHNGNILSLTRNQNQRGLSGTTVTSTAQTIDNLTYTYASGNQLSKVADATALTGGFSDGTNQTTEYTYDTHGNMTQDLNKGIQTITYNALGKAQQMTFTDGHKVKYRYDAAGTKYRMTSIATTGDSTITEYVGGFVYNTVNTGSRALSFFSSPEGRVLKNGSNYEYQYAITDHQGNTRVVFTSATPTATATIATFEGDSGDQSSQFSNVTPISFGSANHTTGGSKVVRLNQATPVGPGLSKSVYPGDKIDMEAYSYYEATSGYGTSVASIASMITSVSTVMINGGADPGGLKASGVNSALSGFGEGANQGDTQPAAFLNYILFDKNYKVMDAGWQVITATSFSKQKVSLPQITVKEPGFIFVYLSYEDQSNNYVYFDDFKVTVTPTAVVQSNEYYPFGLQTANSWTRDNSSNNFLYNAGSELNSTTGMYDLPYRNYDAALGRFFQVDPLAARDHTRTPYHYAGNNPIGFNDPSGLTVDYGTSWENPSYVDKMRRQWEENHLQHISEGNDPEWEWDFQMNLLMAGAPRGGSNNVKGITRVVEGEPGCYYYVTVTSDGTYRITNALSDFMQGGFQGGMISGFEDVGNKYYVTATTWYYDESGNPTTSGGVSAASTVRILDHYEEDTSTHETVAGYNWGKYQSAYSPYTPTLDDFVLAFGVVTSFVGLDGYADAASVAVDLSRGDYKGAAISGAAAMVPYVSGAVVKGIVRYQDRVENATDLYHNFPRAFDADIINDGAWSQRIKDGADWYEMPGSINGIDGVYQLGINGSGEVFHRNFVPFK